LISQEPQSRPKSQDLYENLFYNGTDCFYFDNKTKELILIFIDPKNQKECMFSNYSWNYLADKAESLFISYEIDFIPTFAFSEFLKLNSVAIHNVTKIDNSAFLTVRI